MEPVESYLLAVGNEKSIKVVKDFDLGPECLSLIQNEEFKADEQYLFIDAKVNGDAPKVLTYFCISKREALEVQGPEFKIIINN